MHCVVDAAYLGGYRLQIRFEDGQVRVADLSEHLEGPVFQPLRDPAYFRRFTVNHDIDTVVWPNDADFSPDFLYEIGQTVNESTHPADAPGQGA